jgi:hypothetical protein
MDCRGWQAIFSWLDNPIERQDIRERGIKLLRRLHAPKKDGTHEYDDIVIVGHSLGSAIAYDIILNYWTEVNWDIEIDSSNSELNAALKDIEDFPEKCKSFAKDLKPKVKVPGDVPTPEGSFTWEVPDGAPTAEEYQDLQTKFVDLLHKSSRVSKHEKQSKKEGEAKEFVGNVWRIRDLVTLGCPLTYARSLLADGAGELHYRQAQRELPTCPPAKDPCKDQRGQNSFVFRYVPITPPDCVVPDHTAPFSLTRWTNIFFLQDPIGGPLRPIFGWGIRDVPVDFCEKNDAGKSRSTLSWWDRLRNLTGLAHTRYWTLKDGKPVSQDCARVLREIVHGDQAP